MRKLSKQTKDQLKKLKKGKLIRALEADGFQRVRVAHSKAAQFFQKGEREVRVDFHPEGYRDIGLVLKLITEAGWDEDDLNRLGLIGGKQSKKKR